MPKGWEWDETLYLGSAPYYARGRLPYAPGLADRLADALRLDGEERLVDVGCGPGILALSLAHLFAEVVGVDPDPGMLAAGARRATEAGITNARWVKARAEELPGDLGMFRIATFGQSFHWMDRERVAAIVLEMLEPGGALVHISTFSEGQSAIDLDLPYPTPPFAEIRELIARYLGPVPRAGHGFLRHGSPDGEAAILRDAGFAAPDHLELPPAGPLERTADDIVAWVYSLSGSAPHLFGTNRTRFERDLRSLLRHASPAGRFSQQPSDTQVFIWRKPER